MNELQATRTPEVIAAEIRALTASVLSNIIEIGRRMCEAKEMLEHGEFLPWIEKNTGYSRSTANNFMRLYEEYGDRQGNLFGAEVANVQTFGHLPYSKALALLALPSEEREEFAETHDVNGMTTRELRKALRERDEARAEAEQLRQDAIRENARADQAEERAQELEEERNEARNDADNAESALEKATKRVKELESAPRDVYRDEEAIREAAEEARSAAEKEWSEKLAAARNETAAEWSKRLKDAEDRLAKAAEKAKQAEEKAKKAAEKAKSGSNAELENARAEIEKARAEAEQFRAELEKVKREQTKASVEGDADLAAFQLLFESVQSDTNKMRGLLLKVRGRENSALGEKLTAALLALAEVVKECAS